MEELEQDNEEEFVHYMDDLTEEFQATFNQINLQFYVVFLRKTEPITVLFRHHRDMII